MSPNTNLQQLIHKKHSLWKKWISTRDKGILKEYKKIRNSVKKETIKLTQQEQHRISMECKRNPKRFWKYIHRKTMSKSGVGNLKMDSFISL